MTDTIEQRINSRIEAARAEHLYATPARLTPSEQIKLGRERIEARHQRMLERRKRRRLVMPLGR